MQSLSRLLLTPFHAFAETKRSSPKAPQHGRRRDADCGRSRLLLGERTAVEEGKEIAGQVRRDSEFNIMGLEGVREINLSTLLCPIFIVIISHRLLLYSFKEPISRLFWRMGHELLPCA